MRAVVLVGGEGTRLRPLTLTTPKPLLPVAGIPMLERIMTGLARVGVTDAVLSLGYRPDAFTAAYPAGVCGGVRLEYAVEPEPLDTAGGIAFAARAAGIDDTFLAVNGDVLTDLDVGALLAFHRERHAAATIALVPVDDPSRFGVVPTAADGRVEAFIEKPAPGTEPTNHINAGVYVLEPAVLDPVPQGGRSSIEKDIFPGLVEQKTLYGVPFDAYWIDTGNSPAAYIQSNLDALADTAATGPAGNVERSAVSATARIDAAARIVDSVVFDEAVVARGALVSRSVVGRRAVVGEGAVVEDLSVLGDGAIVPPGAVVRGERVSVVA